MIKKITTIRKTRNSEEYAGLCELLRRLGAEEGAGWEQGGARGTPFVFSSGEVEFGDGIQGDVPDLMFEVSEIEPVYRVGSGMQGDVANGMEVGEIEQTSWNSSLLRVRVGSVEIGFWSHNSPEKSIVAAVEGDLNASGMRFGIVVSRWNQIITERLLHGALDALRRSGAQREDVIVVRVPGAFELPSAARTLAQTGKVDAVITLGCLIRGETTHYEHIAEEATRGIGQSAQETGVPHAYGLLTCEDLEQALDRAGLKAGNKGFEAAMSAVEMVSVGRKLKGF